MENTGTWNSDVALWYLVVFCFPLVMMGVKSLLVALHALQARKIVYVEVEKPVYIKETVTRQPLDPRLKVSKKRKKTQQPKTVKPPKPKNKELNTAILNEVAAGLSNLGFKAGDAKKIASQLMQDKTYQDAETLMKDCLKKI
jgi:hypothetical protein